MVQKKGRIGKRFDREGKRREKGDRNRRETWSERDTSTRKATLVLQNIKDSVGKLKGFVRK